MPSPPAIALRIAGGGGGGVVHTVASCCDSTSCNVARNNNETCVASCRGICYTVEFFRNTVALRLLEKLHGVTGP